MSRNTTKKIRDYRGVTLRPIHNEDEPIPGEIESRFTKDREAQELYQVFVEERGKPQAIPASPKMLRQACEAILAAINKAIIDGKRSEWGNAYIARAV